MFTNLAMATAIPQMSGMLATIFPMSLGLSWSRFYKTVSAKIYGQNLISSNLSL
jgi:hypothetical protein